MLVDGWGKAIRLNFTDENVVIESAGKNMQWGDNDDYKYVEPLDHKFEHGPPADFAGE
jgi:hypothetical protein